jgi:hypothetical protein
MKFSRTDLAPILMVIAGGMAGVIGVAEVIAPASFDGAPAVTSQLLDENGKLLNGATGTWVLAVDLARAGAGNATFVLEQEGTLVTGTYSGDMGTRIAVTGTAEDGLVKLFFASREGLVAYEGSIEGTTMAGTCVYGDLGEGTFRGSVRS